MNATPKAVNLRLGRCSLVSSLEPEYRRGRGHVHVYSRIHLTYAVELLRLVTFLAKSHVGCLVFETLALGRHIELGER